MSLRGNAGRMAAAAVFTLAASGCSTQSPSLPAVTPTTAHDAGAISNAALIKVDGYALDTGVPVPSGAASQLAGYPVLTVRGKGSSQIMLLKAHAIGVPATMLLTYRTGGLTIALSERPSTGHPSLAGYASAYHLAVSVLPSGVEVLYVHTSAGAIAQVLWVSSGILLSAVFSSGTTDQTAGAFVGSVAVG